VRQASALFDVLGEDAPVGLAVVGRDLRFLRVNAALAALNGCAAEAHLGRRVDEVLPEIADELVPIFEHVLATGESVLEREVTGQESDGQPRAVLASWFPVRVDGRVEGVGVLVLDITERRRAAERQALLVEAGEVLDAAVGVDARLERLARLLVPRLADFCKIELLEGADRRRAVAIAHEDPRREALMRRLRARVTLPEEAPVGMATTFATGRARLMRDVEAGAAARSAGERAGADAAALMEEIGPRSQIVVPLRARGRVLGALSLTMAESGRRYTDADLDLARDLGLRAGLAVDNARLYEEAQAHAAAERRRTAQLDALVAASLAIHRSRVLEERLQLIADHARELTGARRATARADADTGALEAVSLHHEDAPVPGVPLTVPLLGRDGAPFGAIEAAGKLEGDFTAADRLALDDLARIAALAMANAQLEARERGIAQTLQAGLLPASLPAVPGLEVAARYLAGGEGTVVGGDVYDLFAVQDDWALVVGDVCGKGAEAAVLTAMVRYTIRAEVAHHGPPGEVLGQLNEAILRQDADGRFCTVLHGRLRVRPGGADLVLASAGHPPPLLRRADGTVAPVPVGGRLLGIVHDVEHPDVPVALGPGDALVCYTDGVTEGRGPGGFFGERRLADLVARAGDAGAEPLAEEIVEAVLDHRGGRTTDDVALLVLRVPRS
jgi:PAS domain S-box-containing protein